MCQKYESYMAVDCRQSYCNNKQAYFLAHPAYASVTAISREEDESTLALQ